MIGHDVVDLDEAGEPSLRFVARVLAPCHRAQARARVDDDPGSAALPTPERASPAARWLARRLLCERLGSELPGIEVVRPSRGRGCRPGAPEVWRRGRRLDEVELSLSHDARYVACAARVRL